MPDPTRRSVIVTGASRGIGACIVRRFAADGAQVAFSFRSDEEHANSLVAEIEDRGGRAVAFRADASSRDETHRLVAEAARALGGLDVLVSNAGVEHFGALAEITEDDLARVFAVNVAGQLWAAQAAAEHLGEGGRIVLSASVSARIAVFEHTLYAASKAAVSAMVLNLAPELGRRGITINAVAPGGTNTDMADEVGARYAHPDLVDAGVSPDVLTGLSSAAGRLAEPEEIAAAVAFLASPGASYVSGSTLAVDGGRI